MRILVTGATGFVGKNFIPDLIKLTPNSEILIVSRNIELSQQIYKVGNLTHIVTTDLDRVVDFDPQVVFHLASFITSRNDNNSVDNILDANVVFGVKLLQVLSLCKSMQLFVNVGTFAEYRMGAMEVNNAYLYSASKTAFKYFVDYYSNLSSYKYIHIVPYSIYGGEDIQKKVMDYIKDSLDAPIPVLMSGGEQILDFIHVKDVSSFLNYIIDNLDKFISLKNGEVLHLGSGRGTQIKELAKMIEEIYGKKCNIKWGALPYRKMDVMHAVAPIGRLIELGWRPSYLLEDEI